MHSMKCTTVLVLYSRRLPPNSHVWFLSRLAVGAFPQKRGKLAKQTYTAAAKQRDLREKRIIPPEVFQVFEFVDHLGLTAVDQRPVSEEEASKYLMAAGEALIAIS